MSNLATPPALHVALPDDLAWLEDDVRLLQRTRARGLELKPSALKPGASRRTGIDLPADAPWAEGRTREHFECSWADGPACVLQLNLADIPDEVRKPEWPRHGVVWVFLDWSARLSSSLGETAFVQYDPRPASEIPWRRPCGLKGAGLTWQLEPSLPWFTPETLPAIADWDAMGALYDDWLQSTFQPQRHSGVALGGWGFFVQGDFLEGNSDYVCAIEELGFGDAGEVYLHYSLETGFYARAHCS